MDEGRAPLFGEHSTYLIVTLFLFHPYLGQKICTKYFTVDFLPDWLAFLREYLCSKPNQDTLHFLKELPFW